MPMLYAFANLFTLHQSISSAINLVCVALTPFNVFFVQYEEYEEEFVDMLDGMFSFVLLDTRDKSFIAARDAIGICPLYMGWGLDGMWGSSSSYLSFY
jgi:glutamine phosphoribosylpyrophosphate amidotransferase